MRACFLVHRWLADRLFSVSSHRRRRPRKLSGVILIRTLIWFMRDPPPWPNHFPKTPPPNISSHWAFRFQHVNVGDTEVNIFIANIQYMVPYSVDDTMYWIFAIKILFSEIGNILWIAFYQVSMSHVFLNVLNIIWIFWYQYFY